MGLAGAAWRHLGLAGAMWAIWCQLGLCGAILARMELYGASWGCGEAATPNAQGKGQPNGLFSRHTFVISNGHTHHVACGEIG